MQKCRICSSNLTKELINLGKSPIANSFIPINKKMHPENFMPLKVLLCDNCGLAQLKEYEKPENIFNDNYAYFSSFSDSWLSHCKKYAEEVIKLYNIKSDSHVVEIASNDGYMLQYFQKKNIKVTGVEPAKNCADVARNKNIYTENIFFTKQNAANVLKKRGYADLIIANNVLAHVPDINDFISGFKILLAKDGVITFEFPHLLKLIKHNQFDTIYHEHYSYLSVKPLLFLFQKHNLMIFKIEELSTHGGSLRIYVSHKKAKFKIDKSVNDILMSEITYGLFDKNRLANFKKITENIKINTKKFFKEARINNKTVIGYGAPAKGNTFLNYCGISNKDIKFTVDKNVTKQNTLLPGTKIPVYGVDMINSVKADYIFILPWNLKDEITEQITENINYSVNFVIAIPELKIY